MDAYRPPEIQADLSLAERTRLSRWSVLSRFARLFLAFYPLLAASLPYFFFVAFWLFWGRIPKPYADDPAYQSMFFSYPHTVAILLMVSWPFPVAAQLLLLWYQPRTKLHHKSVMLVVYLCQCTLAWLMISSDNPINEWFFDG